MILKNRVVFCTSVPKYPILLQFKLEEGCCEAELKEFNNILETIKTMGPQMQVLTIGAILLGLFGLGAYKLIKQRLENNKQIALA